MLFVVPYKTNVEKKNTPWVNYAFAVMLLIFFVGQHVVLIKPFYEKLILAKWSFSGILGHMWLHRDIFHLLVNLIILWVFGNALCASIGNFRYLFLYLACGVLAGIGHLLLDGRPAIGASGALSGVIVLLCLIHPYRRIFNVLLILIIPVYRFSMIGFWYLIIKFFYELVFMFLGLGQVAYMMHISGIAAGWSLAYLLINLKIVKPENSDKDLVQSIYSSF